MPAAVRHKTKIALVTDTDDWAFANIVRQVMRTLGDTYAFSFLPFSSLGHDYVRLMLLLRGHDLTHFFWRNDVMNGIIQKRSRAAAAANQSRFRRSLCRLRRTASRCRRRCIRCSSFSFAGTDRGLDAAVPLR